MLVRRRELCGVLLPACLILLLSPPAVTRQTPPPSESSTVGAVPLETRDVVRLATTPPPQPTTVGAVPLDQGEEEDFMRDEESSTSSPPGTTSKDLPDGMIPWVPYQYRTDTKVHMTPVNLPSALPGFLMPNSTSKGRWLSKDKKLVKLINSRPAFSYPLIPVRNVQPLEQEEEQEEEQQEEVRRVKRGSGSGGGVTEAAQCGGVFRDLYGVIESPGYPLYYPNNKRCLYDLEVPDNYTVKLTCDSFTMQGGANCTYDFLMVDFTGDSDFSSGMKYCGTEPPSIVSNGTRMRVLFQSDDLFRYQGFSCRFRALMPNGNAVPGSFGNKTEKKVSSNNFLTVVQCPTLSVVNTQSDSLTDVGATSGAGGAASLYSGAWDGRCGSQNQLAADRIVGGYTTAEHQFPWMAAVLRSCDEEYCHICGGTIISEEWILTGAHCMQKVPMEELGVLVGDHSLFTISTSQKFIKVKEKVVHPDYNMRGNVTSPLNNDIGLLRLEYPIIFTSQISPLCLPALGETGFGGNTTTLDTTGLDIVGQNATVLGWGMINDDGVFADSLRGAEVEILPNKACNDLFGIMTENMMCTSGANGRGTCFGDSGGPAIVKQPDGSWVQVGIAAFGALSGCEKGYPSGQTVVHKYIDWIQFVTNIAFGANLG